MAYLLAERSKRFWRLCRGLPELDATGFDASGTALDSAYSLTGVGTADIDGLDADESYGDAGTRLIRLFVREAGVNKVYTSTDGVAFV